MNEGKLGNGVESTRSVTEPTLVQGLGLIGNVPAVPLDIIANSVEANSIVTSWNMPTNNGGLLITGYTLFWQKIDATSGSSAHIEVPITSYKISGLSPNTTYQIAVAAINSIGQGAFSKALTIQVKPLPPMAPGKPISGRVTEESIEVSWSVPIDNRGAPITSYIIYWRVAGIDGNPDGVETSMRVTTTHFRIEDLRLDTRYKITVAAVNRLGEGERSATLIGRTAVPMPLAPRQLRSTQVTGDSIEIRWIAPVNASSAAITAYTVYWKTINEVRLSQASAILTPYRITRLQAETAYQIVVAAMNRLGEGARSTILTMRTGEAELPSTPRQLMSKKAKLRSDSFVVSWIEPESNGGADITNYRVYWDTGPIDENSTNVIIPYEQYSMHYRIPDLQPETTYRVTLNAINRVGPGPRPVPLKVTTRGPGIRMRVKVLLEGMLQ